MSVFDDMKGGFDQAFGASGTPPLRLRKKLGDQIAFWGTNCLVMLLIAVCYLVVSAEGLRQMMSVFAIRLYTLPIPAAGLLRDYDGFDKLDLAVLMSALLYIIITIVWVKLFSALMNGEEFLQKRITNPVLFYTLTTVGGIILLGDATLFYFGLEAKASSGWSNTHPSVPLLCTGLYLSLLAGVGAWHADYHNSGAV